jgi:GNAT superfamily N-acetyltransferase
MIIRELVEAERGKVGAFLLALDERDRHWRFCRPMTDEAIRSYVERMRWDEIVVLGAFDHDANVIGLIELCDLGETAELAVAVAPEHRRAGVGRALMERGLLKSKVLGKERVSLSCMAENQPMRRLARRMGLAAKSDGGEMTSSFELEAPQFSHLMTDTTRELIGTITYAGSLYSRTWENILQRLLSTPWSIADESDDESLSTLETESDA